MEQQGEIVGIFILFQNPIDNFVANFELYLIRLALDSINRP
jgi:hypothetical protein